VKSPETGELVKDKKCATVVVLRPRSTDFSYIIRHRAESVRRYPLFSEVPLEDCERIVASALERRYQRGKTLFFEGDPIRQVILLISGCAKLTQHGQQDGQDVILRLVGPGEAPCVECGPKHTHCATAHTTEPAAALVWEASQFETLRKRFPGFSQNIGCVILHNLRELEVRFREICTEKVAPRLSRELLRLLSKFGKETDGHMEIALSGQDLAKLTGMNLCTVSRLLSDWERQGIVRRRRRGVQVLNVQALVTMSENG
jgi:CRP-like cAMP-binding protein